MKLVVFGLTISSSWGNGHATLWRGLCRALARARAPRRVLRARRAVLRRTPRLDGARRRRAGALPRLGGRRRPRPRASSQDADVGMVTSYCPDGRRGHRARPGLARAAARLLRPRHAGHPRRGSAPGEAVPYIGPRGLARLRPRAQLHRRAGRSTSCASGSARARVAPLYGSVDPDVHRPVAPADRYRARPLLPRHVRGRPPGGARHGCSLEPARRSPARRFLVGGAQYPAAFPWTANISLRPPPAARASTRRSTRSRALTLNVTRARDGRDGLLPVGPPVRGRGLRGADPERRVGGARARSSGRAIEILIARDTADAQSARSSCRTRQLAAHRRARRASARSRSTRRRGGRPTLERALEGGACGPARAAAGGGVTCGESSRRPGRAAASSRSPSRRSCCRWAAASTAGVERPRAVSEYLVERLVRAGATRAVLRDLARQVRHPRVLRRAGRRRRRRLRRAGAAGGAVRRGLPRAAARPRRRGGAGRPARHRLVPRGRPAGARPTAASRSCSSRSSGRSSSTRCSPTSRAACARSGSSSATPGSSWVWGAFKHARRECSASCTGCGWSAAAPTSTSARW